MCVVCMCVGGWRGEGGEMSLCTPLYEAVVSSYIQGCARRQIEPTSPAEFQWSENTSNINCMLLASIPKHHYITWLQTTNTLTSSLHRPHTNNAVNECGFYYTIY